MMATSAQMTVVMRKLVLATTHLLTVMTIMLAQMTHAVNLVACVQMLILIVMITTPAQLTAAILTLDVLMLK
jgi:hypothetical protein